MDNYYTPFSNKDNKNQTPHVMNSLRCKALEHFLVVKARTMCSCSRIIVCGLINDYCDHYANAHGRRNGNLQCVQSLSLLVEKFMKDVISPF